MFNHIINLFTNLFTKKTNVATQTTAVITPTYTFEASSPNTDLMQLAWAAFDELTEDITQVSNWINCLDPNDPVNRKALLQQWSQIWGFVGRYGTCRYDVYHCLELVHQGVWSWDHMREQYQTVYRPRMGSMDNAEKHGMTMQPGVHLWVLGGGVAFVCKELDNGAWLVYDSTCSNYIEPCRYCLPIVPLTTSDIATYQRWKAPYYLITV